MDVSLKEPKTMAGPKVLVKPIVYAVNESEAAAVPLDLSVRRNESSSAAVPAEQPLRDGNRVKKEAVCLGINEKPRAVAEKNREVGRTIIIPPAHVAESALATRSRSDLAAVPASRVYRAPEISPLIADHVSPDDHNAAAPTAPDSSAASFRPYNPLLFPAFTDAPMPPIIPSFPPLLASLPPLPPVLPPLPALTAAAMPFTYPLLQDTSVSSLHHLQQQQRQLQQHQQQLQLQQEHQFQLQQQQHLHLQLQQQIQRQQQQLASYTAGGVAFQVGTPLQYASDSPSSSASDCNHFQFGDVNNGMHRMACFIEHHPYCGGIANNKGMGGRDGGLSSSGRSDCASPESTIDERRRILEEDPIMDPEEVAEEIAAIYRQSDFIAFRQRYLENLGPPKNFEKMRRSVPGKRFGGGGPDHIYVMKRQKNNEAAKRSRDAKRQKYIENQISVMYLTKKVSEMKEIKKRLLRSM